MLAGISASASGIGLIEWLASHVPNIPGKPVFLSKVCDDATLRGLGEGWLREHDGERDHAVLARYIYGVSDTSDAHHRESSSSRARVRMAVRDDFAKGRTVILDGWVLSVTEARQCALFSILNT